MLLAAMSPCRARMLYTQLNINYKEINCHGGALYLTGVSLHSQYHLHDVSILKNSSYIKCYVKVLNKKEGKEQRKKKTRKEIHQTTTHSTHLIKHRASPA